MVGLAQWVALFRDSGRLLALIHGLGGFRIDLLVVTGFSFVLFRCGGCFSFKSEAGQKKTD